VFIGIHIRAIPSSVGLGKISAGGAAGIIQPSRWSVGLTSHCLATQLTNSSSGNKLPLIFPKPTDEGILGKGALIPIHVKGITCFCRIAVKHDTVTRADSAMGNSQLAAMSSWAKES
jgi:hypothetical protein